MELTGSQRDVLLFVRHRTHHVETTTAVLSCSVIPSLGAVPTRRRNAKTVGAPPTLHLARSNIGASASGATVASAEFALPSLKSARLPPVIGSVVCLRGCCCRTDRRLFSNCGRLRKLSYRCRVAGMLPTRCVVTWFNVWREWNFPDPTCCCDICEGCTSAGMECVERDPSTGWCTREVYRVSYNSVVLRGACVLNEPSPSRMR
jgi:hypothetical protein